MGLLDGFLNDPNTAGLLGLASGLFNAGGVSPRPISFGQALSSGFSGMNDAANSVKKRLQDEQAAKLADQMRSLQIQGLQSDLGQKQQVIDMNNRIRARLLSNQQPQAAPDTPATPDATSYASAMPGPAGSPKIGGPDWMQAYQQQNPQASPSPMQSNVQATSSTQSLVDRLTREAQIRSQEGDVDGADKLYEKAAKFIPQVEKIEAGTSNGKVVSIITYKDGTQKVSDFGVKPSIREINDGQNIRLVDDNTVTPGQTFQRVQSPDSKASNALGYARLNFEKQQAESSDSNAFTPDAIRNAAARYNIDGTLPPMGMGKNGSAGRAAILNMAAQMASGVDPDQQRRDQVANKGDMASQNAALKAFTSGKQGNTVRSFNVSIAHLDTLGQLSDALNNGDLNLLNKAGNFYNQQTGNPAPTNFNAAKKIVADEVVKAIVGSGGGVADREEATKSIDAANSPAQLKSVINTYKDLMVGQLAGLQQQYETSTGRKDFNKYLSGRSQEIYNTKHGQEAPSGQVTNPSKVSALPGQISKGYRFKGGDPSDQNNWEKI